MENQKSCSFGKFGWFLDPFQLTKITYGVYLDGRYLSTNL
jgi:hypothetical protein